MTTNPLADLEKLGDYLREQRQSARLSLRQLSELAGVSNPYLSQLERGLKRPSAEILGQIAKGLQVSAESLYVRAGLLDEEIVNRTPIGDVRAAINVDPRLTARQKATLLDIYGTFVGEAEGEPAAPAADVHEIADQLTAAASTDSVSVTPQEPPATDTTDEPVKAAPRARKRTTTKTTN